MQVDSPKKYNGHDVLITPIREKQFHRFATANSISHAVNGKICCRLLNVTDRVLSLCKGQKVGIIETFSDNMACYAINQGKGENNAQTQKESVKTPVELEQFAEQYKFNIAKDLDEETRLEMLQLLYKRREAFAKSITDLKVYNKQSFDIELTDNKPVYVRQYQSSPEVKRVIQEHINSWVKNGILVETDNLDFNVPHFLVK